MKSGIKQKIEYGTEKWTTLKFATFMTKEKPEAVEKHFKEAIKDAEIISKDETVIIKGQMNRDKTAVYETVTIYKGKQDGKTLFTIAEN